MGLLDRSTVLQRGPLLERAVDVLGHRQRLVPGDHPSHQQAAVAQDARPQQLGRQLRRCDFRQRAVSTRSGSASDAGEAAVGPGAGLGQQLCAGLVAQAYQAPLALAIALGAVGGLDGVDLGEDRIDGAIVDVPVHRSASAVPPSRCFRIGRSWKVARG